ncbi:Predicted nucleotidyltransferase [Butyrivibrio fibrisolvens DSM 3071]|uniref:Predicted nucleotidyltransferase n=1 Tax=Butyrivibrio fibrisolvens DSM 3071 TaxID=1121131 RepID=A0A1M5YGC6_BUTFI|nr:Predicted nucleotidyltransferase [Butyrivibrio fibrisolvens DSM 3071]
MTGPERLLQSNLLDTDPIDEEHGILDMEFIIGKCKEVFDEYPVNYCILFGSYAKGKANESSDLDFLISTDVKGLKFYGLVEKLRTTLHKRVDVLIWISLKIIWNLRMKY